MDGKIKVREIMKMFITRRDLLIVLITVVTILVIGKIKADTETAYEEYKQCLQVERSTLCRDMVYN